jgi:nitroreductase
MTHPKHAHVDHDVLDVIRQRWSPRAFDATREVPRAELLRLFEAARWAPSSYNAQPWCFVISTRRRQTESHRRLIASMTTKNQAWAAAAPLLALVCVRATLEQNEAPNSHAWYDTGQAVAFLTLQATAQGLSTRQMQGFDAEQARAACEVPSPYEPAVVIAIGYEGDPASLTIDSHRAAEHKPRERRPAAEFVFEERWGEPLGDDG